MKRFLFASGAVLALVLGLNTSALAQSKPADLPQRNQIECVDGSDDPVQPPRFSIELGFDLLSNRLTVKVGMATSPAPTNIDTVCPAVISACLDQLVKQLNASIAAANKRIEQDATKKRARWKFGYSIRIKVRIEHVPLKNAIKQLAYVSGLPIAIDFKAMRNARINLDTPVTLKVENDSTHKALRQFLDDLDLTYEIKNGVVQITTQGKCMRPLSDAEKAAIANDRFAQRLFDVGEKCRRAGDYNRARTCYQQVHRLTPTTVLGRVAIARIIEVESRMTEDAEQQDNPRSENPQEVFQRMRDRTVPLGLVEVSY